MPHVLTEYVVAKHRREFLRRRLKAATVRPLRDAQSGARPNRSTDFCTHATLTAIKHTQNRGQPLLLLFLDLKGACYRVVLQFVHRLPTTPDELRDLIGAMT